MKIAVFHCLPPGGAKRVVYEEIKLLSKKNQIDLYQFRSFENDFLDFIILNSKIFEYNFDPSNTFPGFLSRLISEYKIIVSLQNLHKKIAADIDKNHYDIVIVHPDKYTQAPFLLKYLKTKSIYYCEELLRVAYDDQFSFPQSVSFLHKIYERFIRGVKKIIDKQNAQAASVILTNSKFTKENIRQAYNRVADVCYLGVDSNSFKPLRNQKKNTILYIGAPAEINGYSLLENVLRNNPKIAKRMKIINFFDKKSSLNENELISSYSEAIVTLCLSYGEPFGLVVLESMACGTPVIAVNEAGYKESLLHKKTGYLIKRDEKELTERIIQLMNNQDLANKLGSQGRIYAKNNWTWEKHVACLEKHF